MARYFADYGHVPTRPGALCYLAVDVNEPLGKPILACRKLPVRLELATAEDQAVVRPGASRPCARAASLAWRAKPGCEAAS